MLKVDLHVHSLFSQCGLHTILELLQQARQLGMEGIAITDHGSALGGKLNQVFFDRFLCPFKDLRLIKGIECNLLDDKGTIDISESLMPFLELVLLGIHPNTPRGKPREYYTDLLVAAMEKNPCIDMITHPNENAYPIDYTIIAREAAKRGIVLELNNSRILYSRSSIEDTVLFLNTCKHEKCQIAVCSDTHAIQELGDDSSVKDLLVKTNFPAELVITETSARAFDFIDSRRVNKIRKT